MDNILSFLADNYKWFMLAAVLLLFALIGFIVDGKKKKKNEEVVPVPNADAQAQAATTVAPTNVTSSETAPASAPAVTEGQGLVIEEPSLNNVEATSNEVNFGTEEEGSIFGTPEMQAPASVETNAEDPAVTEGPTLVIEDKEETPEMTATVQSEPVMATPEVTPEVTPSTPEVAPVTPEVAQTPEVVTAPEMAPAPEMVPAPEVVAAPEAPTPVAPTSPEVPSAPQTPIQ